MSTSYGPPYLDNVPGVSRQYGAFNGGMYGAYSGYGGHGGCCHHKKDDNLLELLAVGIALFALMQALMMSKKRRRRDITKAVLGDRVRVSDIVLDVLYAWAESGKNYFAGTL